MPAVGGSGIAIQGRSADIDPRRSSRPSSRTTRSSPTVARGAAARHGLHTERATTTAAYLSKPIYINNLGAILCGGGGRLGARVARPRRRGRGDRGGRAGRCLRHSTPLAITETILGMRGRGRAGRRRARHPVSDPGAGQRPEERLRWAGAARRHADRPSSTGVGALHAAGVPLLAGSDGPNPGSAHGASVHREIDKSPLRRGSTRHRPFRSRCARSRRRSPCPPSGRRASSSFGDACPAICCACSSVPPFDRYAVIPVARNVWQHVEGGSQAAAARRLIIARTSRRSSARPVSRLPAGSMVWKNAAFGSWNPAAST